MEPEKTSEARLFAPVVIPQRNGHIFLIWATADSKSVVSLEFEDRAELQEWLSLADQSEKRLP